MVLQLVQFEGGPWCPCSLRSQWPWRVWRLSRSSNLDTLTFYLGAVNGQRSSSFWFKSHDFPAVIPPSTPLTILAELPTHSRIIGSLRPSVPTCHFFSKYIISYILSLYSNIINYIFFIIFSAAAEAPSPPSLSVTSSSNISYHIQYIVYIIFYIW